MKKSIHLSIPVQEVEGSQDESTEWRNIIFLPFHFLWEFLITASVLINSMFSTFDVLYRPEETNVINVVYYLCEALYLADLVLIIMHRKFHKIRKRKIHTKHPTSYIILQGITVLPIYEINMFLKMTNWKYSLNETRNFLKLKCVLRIFRVFNYLNAKTNEAGLNQLLILTLSHCIRVILAGHFLGATFYSFIKFEPNWTRNLQHHRFQRNNSYNWLLICYTLMTNVVSHNWSGTIKPESNIEKVIFIITMLIGFTLHMMIFIGYLTAAFIKIHRNYYEYETRVNNIISLLNEWEVDDELRKKTIDFYAVFWQKRYGLREMPEMFDILPMSLKKEVTVDIFWEALRHSHFFVGTGMSFKRSVSLVMKSEFLLPGDFLFRIGESKAKMVYIVSGVIQILSDEDDDSPIISFSSGTLLGETACLMAANSGANLRSATYCEIQTLALIDLFTILLKYPLIAKYIRQQLVNRINIAKYDCEKKRKDQEDLSVDVPLIKTVKQRWRSICKQQIKDTDFLTDNHAVRSENFDLLVLSTEVELRVESICLTGQCPFVMDPENGFRRFCDFTILGAVMIQSLIIPRAAFFSRKLSISEHSLCFLMDVIYYIDIYLQVSTAVKTNNIVITEFRKIVIIRLKQFTFLIDLLATFPLDYIAYVGGSSDQNVAFYKLLRILKMYKMFHMLHYVERKMVVNIMTMRIFKFSLMYSFSGYWFSCLTYGLSCLDEHCDPYSWFLYNIRILDANVTEAQYYQFTESIYMTMSLYINYGATDFDALNLTDIVICHIVICAGQLMSSFSFSELIATAILRQQTEQLNRRYLWALKREATQYKIEAKVHSSVLHFLNFHYSVRAGCQVFGEDSIFRDAPHELSNEIVRHRIINCLKKVPLFADSNDALLRYLCAHSELKLIPENATLMRSENKSDILYVIMKGSCKMYSTLPGDLERKSSSILQAGDTFPFLETFHGAFSFISVRTITVVELLLIPTNIVINAFQTDETDNGCFKSALQYHRQVYGSILFRKGARLPMLQSVRKSKERGDMFEYHVYDVDYTKFNEEAYRQPFIKMGGWSFVRFFLLRKTINPYSYFYITWEIFRCIIAIIQMILMIIYPSVLVVTLSEMALTYMLMFADMVFLVDVYIRLHCQYYNDKGILVTHPLSTAKQYISTSFVTDCIANVPVHSSGMDLLLGPSKRMYVLVTVSILARFLQLYRLFGGLTYWETLYKGTRGYIINRLKYIIFALIFIGIMQAIMLLCTCSVEDDLLYCNKTEFTFFFVDRNVDTVPHFFATLYRVSTFYTLSTSGTFALTYYDTMITLIIMFCVSTARWLILSKMVGKSISGNVELTLYRDRMKNYLAFLKGAFVSDEIINSIVIHFEYMWKKSQGMSMYHVLKYFHPQLEQDMAYSLYSNCLERADLFRGEHVSLFQAIAPLFHRQYYTKDTKIIQCNDVQDKVFFVHEGMVEISIANTPVCVLRNGGMFGCLSKGGITRQTLTATATVHSTVLTIHNKILHKTVESFPKVVERLQRANSMNYEYLQEYFVQESQTNLVRPTGLYNRYKTFYDKILINEEDRWFQRFDYINNMHICAWSPIVVLAMTFINLHESHSPYFSYIVYMLDLLHFIEMFFKFHLIYIDPVSGQLVKDPYAIRRRYVKTSFWFDLFTLIPFELLISGYTENKVIQNLCMLNRAFRFVSLVQYYYRCEERLTMKKHLKWMYMIYQNIFYMQIMVCIWLEFACPKRCFYNSSILPVNRSITMANDTLESTLIAYLYVANIYSNTGLRMVPPTTINQLLVTMVMALVTNIMTASLCSSFTSLIMVEQYNFSLYELRFERLWTYLEGRDLSPFLRNKVWDYCVRLWRWHRGGWLPALIKEAPSYLKENMMFALYGKHLANHFLFANTHTDFLRQLVVYLERFVYSPGDSVVEKGDSDCCMYFINKGEINVFDSHGKLETKIECLTKYTSFGEAQGLFCIPHKFSYRANTVAEILILNRNDWVYLLKWFPASNEEILLKSIEHGIKTTM